MNAECYDVETPSLYIDSLSTGCEQSAEKNWFKKLLINDNIVNFKLDTGAEANILPLCVFQNLNLGDVSILKQTTVMLASYGNHKLKPKVEVSLLCSTDKHKNVKLDFLVVDVNAKPILGLP